MGEDSIVWNYLRGAIWPGLAGILVGAGIVLWRGPSPSWLLLGVALLLLSGAAILTARSRPSLVARSNAAAEAGRTSLPPLAREVFERLPDPLMLLDDAGRVLFANSAMRTVVGVGPENKHISSLLRTPAVLEAIERTAASGEPASIEFTVPVPVERHYQAYVARVASPPAVTTLLLHDMTAIKRAEQMRADFVANASHELRTPLAAVSGFIDTLKGHAREDVEARDRFLDIMTVEAGRMRRLIEDLLSLTRIELNEHVRPSGTVSLEAIVREAATALSALAQADEITLEVNAAPNLPLVTGERDELIQLFQNLIHNAIKYGKPGGHVWITLTGAPSQGGRGTGTMVSARVRDDGEGIASDAIPRLTERFYRVDVKRSREKGGTGLGLAIVKHIVNRHQGRLTIESHAGEGSAFTVLLPSAPADNVVTELL
jgi:two-component system phosphate regulon sensor histidine kinase PhoR